MNDDALERHPGLRFGLQKLLSTTTPEEYARRSEIVEYMMEEAMRASKGKPRDDADKREEEDERRRDESEPVDEPEHSALHVTDPRKGESTSEQTMDVEVAHGLQPRPTLPGSTPCDPSHKKCAKCGRYERHRFRRGTKDLQCVRCYQTAYREKQRNKKPGTGRRANNPWTRDEEEALRTGIQEIGRTVRRTVRWQDIMNHPALSKRLTNRSAVDLRAKWRNMCMKSDKEEHSPPSPNQRKNEPEPGNKSSPTGVGVWRKKYTSGRERWQASIIQNKERKALGMYDTKEEAENARDRYLEDPEGFVVPPPSKRRKGTGSVKPSQSGRRFAAKYNDKHIGTFDTETEANDAIDAIRGTSKTNPVTSSTSGLEELAMVAALEQPESSKRPRGDDEEDVEKFTEFEVGHLVFARVGKANWAPAQISAISTSTKGQVYDVEFFVKEKNGVYPRAQNLPLSKLEAADEDTFEKHSGRKESKNWVDGMEKFRRLYDKSRRV